MNNETINGIGKLEAGEYDNIEINGGAKSTGVIKCKKIIVGGLLNAGDKIEAEEFIINGRTTSKGDIIGDRIVVNGMLQLNEQNIKVRELICKGTIQCLGSVFSDDIIIDGLCNINNMQGRTITLRTDNGKKTKADISGGVGKIFLELCSVNKCTLKSIDCDEIKADNCHINILKANNIELTNNCEVDIIYCNGDILIDQSCKVGEIVHTNKKKSTVLEENAVDNKSLAYEDNAISEIIMEPIKEFDTNVITAIENIGVDMNYNNKVTPLLDITDSISFLNKDGNSLEKNNIVSMEYNEVENILINYKEGRTTLEESKKAIKDFIKLPMAENVEHNSLPWEDDNNLRIVAYRGTTILKTNNPNLKELTVEYLGEVLSVECMGSLICGDVNGDIRSRGSVTCKDVEGDIRATGNINCSDVSGNVDSGENVNCNDIGGYVEANGDVSCNNVTKKRI